MSDDNEEHESGPLDMASLMSEILGLHEPTLPPKEKYPLFIVSKLRYLLERLEAVSKPPGHDEEEWTEMCRFDKWQKITSSNSYHPWVKEFLQSTEKTKHEDVFPIVEALYDICFNINDEFFFKPSVNLEPLKQEKFRKVLECLDELDLEMTRTPESILEMLDEYESSSAPATETDSP